MPLLPFRELLGSYFDVEPLDAPDVARARIVQTLRRVEHVTESTETQLLDLPNEALPRRVLLPIKRGRTRNEHWNAHR